MEPEDPGAALATARVLTDRLARRQGGAGQAGGHQVNLELESKDTLIWRLNKLIEIFINTATNNEVNTMTICNLQLNYGSILMLSAAPCDHSWFSVTIQLMSSHLAAFTVLYNYITFYNYLSFYGCYQIKDFHCLIKKLT